MFSKCGIVFLCCECVVVIILTKIKYSQYKSISKSPPKFNCMERWVVAYRKVKTRYEAKANYMERSRCNSVTRWWWWDFSESPASWQHNIYYELSYAIQRVKSKIVLEIYNCAEHCFGKCSEDDKIYLNLPVYMYWLVIDCKISESLRLMWQPNMIYLLKILGEPPI